MRKIETREFFKEYHKCGEGTIYPGYAIKLESPIFDSQISISYYTKPAFRRELDFFEPAIPGYEIHFACAGATATAFFTEFSNLVEKYNRYQELYLPITPKPTRWQRFRRLFRKPQKSISAPEVYDALKALVEYATSGEFDALKRKELIENAAAVLKKYEKDHK